MKKLLFFTIMMFSLLVFGQERSLFKTISYGDLVKNYNTTLKLKGESLEQNIERCVYIIKDAHDKKDWDTEFAFTIFLKGLKEVQSNGNMAAPFLSIYKDATRYNFYDSKDTFVGAAYADKFKPDNDTGTYLEKYFYLLQE